MKRITLLAIAAMLAMATTYYVLKTEKDVANKSKKVVNTSTVIRSLPQNSEKPQSTTLKKTYTKRSFPTNTPDQQQCIDLRSKQNRLQNDYYDDIELVASNAFKNGYTAEQVANAIWSTSSWSPAQVWYKKAIIHEAVTKLMPSIKLLPNNQQFLDQYTFVNKENSPIKKVVDYSESLDEIWQGLPSKALTLKATSTNTSSVEVVNEIERIFSQFPYDILNNRHISPLQSVLSHLVTKKRIPAAIMLLQQYPGLAFSEVIFDNEAATSLLSIIGNEGYEIDDPQTYRHFLELSGVTEKDIYYQDISHPLFNNKEIKIAVKKLSDKGINVNLISATDLAKPEPILQLNIKADELTEAEARSLDKCNATKQWLEERQFSLDDLDIYTRDSFTDLVRSSPEFSFCERNRQPENLPTIKSQFTRTNQLINQTVANQGISIEELDLMTLELPELLPETNSVLGVILARDYLKATSLSKQEIITKLSNAGFKPSDGYLALFSGLAKLKGYTIWLDSIPFEKPEYVKGILNEFASNGIFEPFSKLSSAYPEVEFDRDTELDPFYFFIKNYSNMSLFFGDISAQEKKDNTAFINYFKSQGVEVKPQHMRAVFERKKSEPDAYDALTKHFPQLKVEILDDYFSLDCL